ncbi:serine hydrolase FSH [Dichotomopilus funicola]|uniref:Serine hydrolase FSH n=1 Tax=Dichotomopilus funicola TaxID=1934379 RepID=A0AAN6V312_9PEZI|nr:serine hydrolase FSH [Dichotomopilus funicola]
MSQPKILFLHGSGTNPDIYRLQTRKLAEHLRPHFTLLYPAAPIPRDAGPGVLPIFAGCDPFLTWLDDTSTTTERAFWGGARADGDTVDSSDSDEDDANTGGFQRLVDEVKSYGKGVVALVGFSMGAKVGMEVVRRLEAEGISEIKIMVSVCGTVPYQGGGRKWVGQEESEAGERGYQERIGMGVVKAQSVHLIGERDPWRSESEQLVDFFEETRRTVVVFRGGHHMPVEDALNGKVARMIMTACWRK